MPNASGKQTAFARAAALVLTVMAVAVLMSSCGGGRAQRAGRERPSGDVMGVLKAQYREWKGVRYKIGGLSKRGVDCSGFVHLTFRRMGRSIPRTTAALAGYGKEVGRRSLRPGDLVFFKTGIRVRHVGIYYGGDRFLHASTSSGVMVSELDEGYWKKRFWQARRVL